MLDGGFRNHFENIQTVYIMYFHFGLEELKEQIDTSSNNFFILFIFILFIS